MRVEPYQYSSYQYHASLRSRAAAWIAAIAVAALIVLMLILAGAITLPVKQPEVHMVTIEVPQQVAGSKSRAATAKHATGGTVTPRPSPPKPIVPPVKPVPTPPLNLIPMSKDDLASLDTTMHAHHEKSGPQMAGGGEGDGSGSGNGTADDGSGDGPNGHKLYNVDWYTRPTPAQMNTYLRGANAQTGWGEIKCKTIDHYHVDDCEELAESPGSGIARAMRQAAWQFLVRPPRIDGTPQIGVWVRIRFDYTINHDAGDHGDEHDSP